MEIRAGAKTMTRARARARARALAALSSKTDTLTPFSTDGTIARMREEGRTRLLRGMTAKVH